MLRIEFTFFHGLAKDNVLLDLSRWLIFMRYLINVASLWSGITSTKDWHKPCFSWGGGEHLGPMFFCWYAEYHHPPFMELSVTHSQSFTRGVSYKYIPQHISNEGKVISKGAFGRVTHDEARPHHGLHVQRLKDNVLLTVTTLQMKWKSIILVLMYFYTCPHSHISCYSHLAYLHFKKYL